MNKPRLRLKFGVLWECKSLDGHYGWGPDMLEAYEQWQISYMLWPETGKRGIML